MPPAKRLQTRALQRNIESLLRLLGGTPDQRLEFWEIIKGVTTPAVFRVANQQLKTMEVLVNQVQVNAANLKQSAKGRG
ncbi:MAG: hypothetical protein ABIQ55_00660 [Gemmatimonadaceae bacterium]